MLQATINFHLKNIGQEHLLKNFFVEDLSAFKNSVSELFEFQQKAKESFCQISKPLAKYVSNSPEVNNKLLAEGLIKEIPKNCKILGMLLDIKLDAYVIKLPDFNVTNPTLTTVLSDHSQIWDIVGFVEPVRLLSK